MAAIEKPSVSGYMTQHHEISRFENLFFKTINSAYYQKKWGLDWPFWLDPTYNLPINSFISYLTQESVKRGIMIDSIEGRVENFTLTITVVIEGITFETNQFMNGGG